MFTRRKEDRAHASFEALHVEARTNRAVLHGLLLRGAQGLAVRPWLIDEDYSFRHVFRELAEVLRRERRFHYSLRAHYEHLEEVAVDALARFVDPATAITSEALDAEMGAVFNAFEELDALNAQAWEKESKTADVAGAVGSLLTDARKTVGDLIS